MAASLVVMRQLGTSLILEVLLILLINQSHNFVHAQPAEPLYFHHQIVDHLDSSCETEWTQRYYIWDQEFKGPGHPIFIILGGEGSVSGLMYPFVTQHLAKNFGAFVLEPEHRFYGESQPLKVQNVAESFRDHKTWKYCAGSQMKQDPRVRLLTSEQALLDAMHLLSHVQDELQCSRNKNSIAYCPVITVGGSYPGFLAAFSRIMFPNRVDMAYAASAPMKFYSQEVEVNAYYNHITKVAEDTLQGCSQAIQISLQDTYNYILSSGDIATALSTFEERLGICPNSIPNYIQEQLENDPQSGLKLFAEELMMVAGYTFANANMANYPPSNRTGLYRACRTFANCSRHSLDKVKEFLVTRLPPNDSTVRTSKGTNKNYLLSSSPCWNMTMQLPSGSNATISSGDWSGVGSGASGESWDFQTCTLLVEAIGYGVWPESMFPKREWTLEWMTEHCQSRFGVTPQPHKVVDHWKFTEDGLVSNNVTRILFTNGLKDGWSVGGIQTNLSESLLALNFPNGAHHSDLSHVGPSNQDTVDIQAGFRSVNAILSSWLEETRPPRIEQSRVKI